MSYHEEMNLTRTSANRHARKLKKAVLRHGITDPVLIGTGSSGMGTISILGCLTGFPKVYVRKPDDISNHGCVHPGSSIFSKSLIFCDDVIDSGATFKYVLSEVSKFNYPVLVGYYVLGRYKGHELIRDMGYIDFGESGD